PATAGHDITANGAVLSAAPQGSGVFMTSTGGAIDLTGSTITTNGAVTVTANLVSGQNVTLDNLHSSADVNVKASGTITQNAGTAVSGDGSVSYRAGSGITVQSNAAIINGNSNGGPDCLLLTTTGDIVMAAGGHITGG